MKHLSKHNQNGNHIKQIIVNSRKNQTSSKFYLTVSHTFSSASRISRYSYNSLPWAARKLIDIPVTVAQTIQHNIFPTILFTEGYHVFRQNFGFSRDKAANNLLLCGMILCTASKFFVNPWFDKEHEAIDAIWYKMGDKTIPNEEYYASFNAAIWEFTKALSALVSTQVLNGIFSSLLRQAITFKRQYELAQEWLSNFTAYGINAGNKSSGSEADNEKANLSAVKLFEDIEHQSALPSLWNTRINTIIDCLTACYALFTMSPTMVLSFYFVAVTLPRLLVISFAYSLTFNTLLSFFEGPAHILHQKLNQLKDLIIRQITNIDQNAELITFLEGEEFEEIKLLNLLNENRRQSIKHDLLDAVKDLIVNFITQFQWLFPILATIKDVRNGDIKQEEIGPCMTHYFRINAFMTWVKNNFEQLSAIEESVRRLALYEERIQAWNAKRVEIEKKVTDSNSNTIHFSGSIFADEKHVTLLARGNFTLPPRSITHIDAPSGCGKTTLFRIFRRIWGDFEGQCSLPKQKSAFLPSHVYVLGGDEPLFQTICYPINHKRLASKLGLMKNWLTKLNLPPHVINNLVNLPISNDEKANKNTIFNWMSSLSDGERKRIAFCNILLKLTTQEILFLVMDEPFKGIDFATQRVMVKLLKDVIASSNKNCTVLFSNHEHNHELNTHTLTVNKHTKKYKLDVRAL